MLAVGGTFVASQALAGFVVAALGGIILGAIVGRVAGEILRRLDDPPVEVVISFVIPFAAYLPADQLGLSGVSPRSPPASVIGSRLGTILSPRSRILWLSTWKMVGFVLNGFVFVLIGLELPEILSGLGDRPTIEIVGLAAVVCGVVVGSRIVWVFASSLLPGSPRRVIARRDPRLATRLTFVVGWAGLRGAVSLAAALALPTGFPERNLILFLTFAVILVTLVGQGLTLPCVLRWAGWTAPSPTATEASRPRSAAHTRPASTRSPARGHCGRITCPCSTGSNRASAIVPSTSPPRIRRRRPNDAQGTRSSTRIQRGVIAAQRTAVIELRDRGEINDQTLRTIERELDLEELRMEG